MLDTNAANKDFNINQIFTYEIKGIDNEALLVEYDVPNLKFNNPLLWEYDLKGFNLDLNNYDKKKVVTVYNIYDKTNMFIRYIIINNSEFPIMAMIKIKDLYLLTVDKDDKLYKLLFK